MLAFTYNVKLTEVTVYFDRDGLNQLRALLDKCNEPGDHVHLMTNFGFPYSLDACSIQGQHELAAVCVDMVLVSAPSSKE